MGGALAAYQLVLASADREVGKVPDDATVYVTVFIDPPLTQKLALVNLAKKFPQGETEQSRDDRINQEMDKALKDSGLSFKDDVRPWLGSQVSFEARVDSLNGSSGPGAFLIASKDDKKALAALDKAREHDKNYDWSKQGHNGVDIWVGKRKSTGSCGSGSSSGGSFGGGSSGGGSSTSGSSTSGSSTYSTCSSSSGDPETAYAVSDGTAVLGYSQTAVELVIDTAQGKHGRLSDSNDYKNVQKRLTSDRVVAGYINLPTLAARLKTESGSSLPDEAKSQLDALRPLGFTVSARDNALVADVAGDLDASKLDAETRAALTAGRHQNAMLGNLPKDAYGAYGGTGLRQLAKQVANLGSSLPSGTRDKLKALGLDDPNGPASHLGPDYAIDVGPGANGDLRGVGLVVSTDDEVGTAQFLDRLLTMWYSPSSSSTGTVTITPGAASSGTPSSPPAGDVIKPQVVHPTPSTRVSPTPRVTATPRVTPPSGVSPKPPVLPSPTFPTFPTTPTTSDQQYRGVTIKTFSAPFSDTLGPAYAVASGTAMLATDTDEVMRLIDKQGSGDNITASEAWKAAAADSPDLGATFLFANFDLIRPAVEKRVSSGDRSGYDQDVAPWLKPLKALMASGRSDAGGYSAHLVLVVN